MTAPNRSSPGPLLGSVADGWDWPALELWITERLLRPLVRGSALLENNLAAIEDQLALDSKGCLDADTSSTTSHEDNVASSQTAYQDGTESSILPTAAVAIIREDKYVKRGEADQLSSVVEAARAVIAAHELAHGQDTHSCMILLEAYRKTPQELRADLRETLIRLRAANQVVEKHIIRLAFQDWVNEFEEARPSTPEPSVCCPTYSVTVGRHVGVMSDAASADSVLSLPGSRHRGAATVESAKADFVRELLDSKVSVHLD